MGSEITQHDIDRLIRFHQAGLHQYQQFMEPSAQRLEEETIKALQELKGLKAAGKVNG